MKRVFADAGYWIAILNPRDTLHLKALEVSRALRGVRVVTSEMVLAEVLNALASAGERLREVTCQTIDSLRANPNAEIVPCTSAAFREAMNRYRASTDKGWGVTDCNSFLIMEERGITEALAHDRHFQQAGFKALLREGLE